MQDGLTRAPEWALLTGVREKLTADVVAYVDIACADLLRKTRPTRTAFAGSCASAAQSCFSTARRRGHCVDDHAIRWRNGLPRLSDPHRRRGRALYAEGRAREPADPVHCNGDAAADQMIAAYRKDARACPNNVRPSWTRELVRRDQLAEMARLGMLASFFAAHVYHWGDAHLKTSAKSAPPDQPGAHGACARRALQFSSGFPPCCRPTCFETLALRHRAPHKGWRPSRPDERVTPLEALRCMTIGGAYAYFEENEKGTLESGKIADMVVLNRDPPPARQKHSGNFRYSRRSKRKNRIPKGSKITD